jgi:hypothetical protein
MDAGGRAMQELRSGVQGDTQYQKRSDIKNPRLEKAGQEGRFMAPFVADCLKVNPYSFLGHACKIEIVNNIKDATNNINTGAREIAAGKMICRTAPKSKPPALNKPLPAWKS